jgi:hypothetical protein
MRTTAFLTLTGTSTVIREWLKQLAAGSAASPELLWLGAALVGLGGLTLYSHWTPRSTEAAARPAPAPPVLPAGSQHA